MKCNTCQREGHRTRNCHKYPPPASELMEEDEEVPQDAQDSAQPTLNKIVEGIAGLLTSQEGDAVTYHEGRYERIEERLESGFHSTNELIKSLRGLLTKATNQIKQQDKLIGDLAEKLNGTNDRLDQLTAENRVLQAEVAKGRQGSPAPTPQPPPPPPPQFTFGSMTPPPQPKRKRDPAVGATPRKPAKQPRDSSIPPTPRPTSPTPAPPTKDHQGWTEVKKKKRRNKGGESKVKGDEKAHASKGRSGGRKAPTWAQVAQGGGVHVTVYYGSGNPKPTEAQPPKRRRSKGKERKATGSGPGKGKEAEKV